MGKWEDMEWELDDFGFTRTACPEEGVYVAELAGEHVVEVYPDYRQLPLLGQGPTRDLAVASLAVSIASALQRAMHSLAVV